MVKVTEVNLDILIIDWLPLAFVCVGERINEVISV